MVGGARRRVVVTATASSAGSTTGKSRRRGSTKAIYYAIGVVLLIPGGSLSFFLFEHGHDDQVRSIGSAVRWTMLTLLEDQAPFDAKTGAGTAVTYLMLVGGLVFVAVATASLATRLVEILLRPDAKKVRRSMRDHIIICGWSAKGDDIVRELRLQRVESPIVVLAPLTQPPADDSRVTFVKGHANREEDLIRAGMDRAATAIVLADDSNPSDDADDIDARTLLTTLAIETTHPDVHTCVEVLRARNRRHFERANADELIVSDEMTGAMIANSAITHGLSNVVTDLVTHSFGGEFAEIPPPAWAVGMPFVDAIREIKRLANCLLVAVASPGLSYEVNPAAQRPIARSDRLLVITADPEG